MANPFNTTQTGSAQSWMLSDMDQHQGATGGAHQVDDYTMNPQEGLAGKGGDQNRVQSIPSKIKVASWSMKGV